MRITPAYIAGFFDGDGCVGIYVRKPRPSQKKHLPEYFVRCQLSQNNKPFLEVIRDEVGGHLHFQPQSRSATAYGSCWVLYWTHRKAETFLRYIEPHVILKLPEVQLALRLRELKLRPGHRPPPNYIEQLEELRSQMRMLKTGRNNA